MAWFRNKYECYRCAEVWEDEWSCGCDDECPNCEARDVGAYDSEDLTFVIFEEDNHFEVWRSPDDAEHKPDYHYAAMFLSREFAEAYIRSEPSESSV